MKLLEMLRRPALSYADGVLTYRQAVWSYSYSTAIAQRYQTENFYVHPNDRLPFPLDFRNHNPCPCINVMARVYLLLHEHRSDNVDNSTATDDRLYCLRHLRR